MGLWRWLFGRRARGVVVGDDEFEFRVVGTLHHQRAIENMCGRRSREGAHRYCAALLTPQPTNPHDRHAVAVTIHDVEVGFLDREDARDFLRVLGAGGYADAACEAELVGGWDRGGDDQGYFGVRLNACLPFSLYPAQEWHRRRHEAALSAVRRRK